MEKIVKTCSKCKKEKGLSEFYNCKIYGKTFQCKECDKEYRRQRESGERQPIRKAKTEELGKMVELENGRFRFKREYRNTFSNSYYDKVKCVGCDNTIFRDTHRRSKHSFCEDCSSTRGKYYYPLLNKKKSSGHVLTYMPDHPQAKKNFVPEHRVVVEKRIGRYLTEEEKVHHINCIKDDNVDSNLWLTNMSGHTIAHNSLNQCVKPLMDAGYLIFDEKEGIYKPNLK